VVSVEDAGDETSTWEETNNKIAAAEFRQGTAGVQACRLIAQQYMTKFTRQADSTGCSEHTVTAIRMVG
jgi:hypothetical protein